MLTVLLGYLLITAACLVTGFVAVYAGRALTGHSPAADPERHPMVYLLWGVVLLSTLAQAAVLFSPVRPQTGLFMFIFLLPLAWWQRKAFTDYLTLLWQAAKRRPALPVAALLILLCISNLGAGPIIMDDTDSYHIQCIKWIQEYGTVPGLANLHERYGFNSSWFSFSALFIPAGTHLTFFSLANGALSAWFCGYLVSKTFPHKSSSAGPSRIQHGMASAAVLLTALLCWPMIRGNATTANYDFITTCMVTVLFLEVASRPLQARRTFLAEALLWPVFLCTVRAINFPFLLISLAAFCPLINPANRRNIILYAGMAAVMTVPFLVRNVMLSGYLLYPSGSPDFFHPDWKVDAGQVQELLRYIKYFNRVNTGFMPLDQSSRIPFPDWIPVWFHYLFRYDKPVLLLGLAGYGISFVFWRKRRQLSPVAGWIIAAFVLQLLSWFWVAPDPRFVYGPLLCGIYLFVFFPGGSAAAAWYSKLQPVLFMAIIAGLCGYTILRAVRDPQYRQLVWPMSMPVPPVHVVTRDNIRMVVPGKLPGIWNARCYCMPLPCLYRVSPRLRARGLTMADGFKLVPQSDPNP